MSKAEYSSIKNEKQAKGDAKLDVVPTEANGNESNNQQEETPAATIYELYQYADSVDLFFMFFGTAGAMASGFCQPAFCLLFGYALDDLNSSNNIEQSINTLVVYLVILGIGNFIVATIETGCWGITGERQAQKFRENYVKAILSQEIGWFDMVGANQLATKLADMSGQLRDGMSYKTADFLQFASQVIGAVIVGLALDPYVALIMFACKLVKEYFRSKIFIHKNCVIYRYSTYWRNSCSLGRSDSICNKEKL
jgi:ATP-binding cassette subfamily B (MDR/TAP) protein 1